MALSDNDAKAMAARLVSALDADLQRDGAKGKIRRYLKGDQNLPYMPKGAKAEYKSLAERSVTNWLPLISDTFAKGLFVDGYRPARTNDNAPSWAFWQANGMDARQSIAHRGALDYGTSLTLVLPGDTAPLIRPLPPVRTSALYADPDDEFPEFALVTDGRTDTDDRIVRLYTSTQRITLTKPKNETEWKLAATEEHNLGVTPLVRFRDRLDDEAVGIVAPLFTIQDRVNENVFALQIALQYASFRQRWATGLVIPTDESAFLDEAQTVANPNFGKPVEPFAAAVDRLWVSDSPEAKFGDFGQTDTSGHLASYTAAVRSLAAIAQTPPHVLLGDLVNLSADALAASAAATQGRISEYETLFGESWEQVFRLASVADGDAEALTRDADAEVRWRDTEARSMAATVDALGKMAQMLGVPAEALWERIPGVTDGDVKRWREMRSETDVFGALAGEIARQAAPVTEATPTGG